MNDLISRSALLEAMPKNDEIFSFEVRRVICNAPAVDAEVVRHGRWIHDINNLYGCSECMARETMSHRNMKNFCPWCGAKMQQDDN